jgi:hypothetical protein
VLHDWLRGCSPVGQRRKTSRVECRRRKRYGRIHSRQCCIQQWNTGTTDCTGHRLSTGKWKYSFESVWRRLHSIFASSSPLPVLSVVTRCRHSVIKSSHLPGARAETCMWQGDRGEPRRPKGLLRVAVLFRFSFFVVLFVFLPRALAPAKHSLG